MTNRWARIADGIVAEIVEIPEGSPPLSARYHPSVVADMVPVPAGAVVADGWRYQAPTGLFTAPAPVPAAAPVVPQTITRRQLLIVMAGVGLITGEEALAAAMTGAVPASIDAVFVQMPPDQALAARITWATMSVAERDHPLIAALVAAKLATAAEVDALFTSAATL